MPERSRLLKSLALAAGLAALLPALGAAQNVMPHRKAGMWETTMTASGQRIVTGLCTDESIERRYSLANPQQMGGRGRDCTGMTPQPIPGGFRMEGTCTDAGHKVHMTATLKGDFNTAYTMDVVNDLDGKPEPPIHMDAKYTGACPADRKPGDMVMPGGTVVNIAALAAADGGPRGGGGR